MRQASVSVYGIDELAPELRRAICEGERKKIRANEVLNIQPQVEQFRRILLMFGITLDVSPVNKLCVFYSIEHNRFDDGAAFWGKWNLAHIKYTDLISFNRAIDNQHIAAAMSHLAIIMAFMKSNHLSTGFAQIHSHTSKFSVIVRDVSLGTISEMKTNIFLKHFTEMIAQLNTYFHRQLRNEFDRITSYENITEQFRKAGAEFIVDGTRWIWSRP